MGSLWIGDGRKSKKKKKKFHPFAHLIHTIILQGKQREMVMPILQKGKLRLEGIETLAEEEPEAENPDFLLIGKKVFAMAPTPLAEGRSGADPRQGSYFIFMESVLICQ